MSFLLALDSVSSYVLLLVPNPAFVHLFRAELAKVLAETDWGDKSRRYFLSREEEHVGGLKAATAIW